MENDNENELDTRYDIPARIIVALFVLSVPAFFIFYNRQESKITDQLNECSFYTIINPTRMATHHRMYYYFYHKNKRYDDYTRVEADELRYYYTKKGAMSSRYWVRIYCKDFKISRVQWAAKVPDTLQYIPANGWKEIPYDLGEEE